MSPRSDHAPSSRGISSLELAEQVALWTWRSGLAHGRAAIERTAAQVFGRRGAPEAVRHAMSLVDAVRRSPLAEGPLLPLRSASVSAVEADMLDVLAVYQWHGNAWIIVDRWGWPHARDGDRVRQALEGFAGLLLSQGLALPVPHGSGLRTAAPVTRFSGLDERERALVRLVRNPGMRSHHAALTCLFDGAELPGVGDALDRLALAVHSGAAAKLPGEGCAGDLRLSDLCALFLVSCTQRGRWHVSRRMLRRLVGGRAADQAIVGLDALCGALSSSGHRLPLRIWRLGAPAHEALAPAHVAAAPAFRALH